MGQFELCFGLPFLTQRVTNVPAMEETMVQSLVWKDPLQEGVQAIPVFLPGESREQRSLVSYGP